MHRIVRTTVLLISLAVSGNGLTGCVSARVSDREATRLFREGNYDASAERLRLGVDKQGDGGRDVLIYLLDLGLALHSAGRLEESNRALLKADDIADIKDYTSLAAEGATLLTSDNLKHYKGEDFEKVLINTYLAINYAVLGKFEDALVEARRVNRKLERMVTEGKRKYQQNAFARYLSGILYETERDWDGAYIDYKKTRELMPDLPLLGRDLWRLARLSGQTDDLDRWEKEFGLSDEDKRAAMNPDPRQGQGEIVVIYENGISPEKRANPQFASLPRFFARFNPVRTATISVRGASLEAGREQVLHPSILHDIEATAIAQLEERYGGLVGKKLAGIAAKEIVGNQIGRATNSEGLAFLTKIILHASDQADLRSWNLLPRDLQLARLTVNPGKYVVRASPGGGHALPEKTVQVEAGGKTFVVFRYMP